jgi:hypothetical protein
MELEAGGYAPKSVCGLFCRQPEKRASSDTTPDPINAITMDDVATRRLSA